jgi:LacI family transcriptional regulator
MQAEIEKLLAMPASPTALCFANDRLTVTAYGILRLKGISIPEDMSVAGYDDYRVISETLYPQLTTMELPYSRMGEAAALLMLAHLRGEPPEERRILIRGELRWRASVVPWPATPIHSNQEEDHDHTDADQRGPAADDLPGRSGRGADRA